MSMKYNQTLVVDTYANLPAGSETGQLGFVTDVQTTFYWNSAAWLPLGRSVIKKSTVTIDGKTVASTPIYTLEPSALNFYPTQVVPIVVNTNTVITPPTVSIGSNATSYNNISSAGLLSTVLSTLGAGSGAPQMATASPPLAGGSIIRANVTVGAVATTYQMKYAILGYYDV